MSRPHGDWTIAYADEAMVAAHIRSLLVLSWRTGADVAHIERISALQRRLVDDGLAPLTVINIFSLESKAGISEELRRDGYGLYEEMIPHYLAQAYVVQGEGFWAAGIRAFLAAFTGLTAQRVETKTFGSIVDAMTWSGQLEDQQPWLRSNGAELTQQIVDVVLGAHEVSDVPAQQVFVPTKPQRIERAGEDASSPGGAWTTTCGGVHLSYWTETATPDDVALMQDDIAALAGEVGGPVALILFVAPGTPLSSAAALNRAATMLRDLHEEIEGVAVVTSGSGLWSMALRSMFRGIALVMPTKVQWRTFGELEPAVGWLQEQSKQLSRHIPDAASIEHAVETLRLEAEPPDQQ